MFEKHIKMLCFIIVRSVKFAEFTNKLYVIPPENHKLIDFTCLVNYLAGFPIFIELVFILIIGDCKTILDSFTICYCFDSFYILN